MAAHDLTFVPLSEFPQLIDLEIEALNSLVTRAFARVHLSTCDFAGAWGECNQPATVHHIASEQEFCLRHFQVVSRG